jgi:uncharacterized protein
MFDPASHPLEAAGLTFVAGILAGAINSVAGGGTLISFTILYQVLGLQAKVANATNTMGLWPASLAGAWGFRKTVPADKKLVVQFTLISILGGIAGAFLLVFTAEQVFKKIVPWLILMAAMLFILQEHISKFFEKKGHAAEESGKRSLLFPLLFQFFVGVYGGYFGAGIGIIMLGALSLMQVGNIYEISFLKNVGALVINGSAVVVLGTKGLVQADLAAVMAAGSIVGGLCGSGLGKKIGPRNMRRAISVIGVIIAGYMIYEQFIKKSAG